MLSKSPRGADSAFRPADFIVPPVFFLAGLLAFSAVAARQGVSFGDISKWSKWDSGHYLAIAGQGYEFFPCPSSSGYPEGEYCGNTGWFPGYPLLVRLVMLSGLKALAAGVVVSGVLTLLVFYLLWESLGRKRDFAGALLVMAMGAFFPGSFYLFSVFPLSLCVCAILLGYRAFQRGDWLKAGIAGAVAAFSYPTGILFAVVTGLVVLLKGGKSGARKTIKRLCAVSLVPALGLAGIFIYQRFSVGVWDAFLKIQHKYAFQYGHPWATFKFIVRPVKDGWTMLTFIPFQELLVALVVLALVAYRVYMAVRGRKFAHDLQFVHLCVFWFVPLCLGQRLAPHRGDLLLLPALAIFGAFGRGVRTAGLAAFLAVSCGMSWLFFAGKLG